MTTIDTLTDFQIETLRGEAMNAGDYVMAFTCDIAARGSYDDGGRFLDRDERERLDAMTRATARAAVIKTINYAETQASDARARGLE